MAKKTGRPAKVGTQKIIVRVRNDLLAKWDALATREKRDRGKQLEVILEAALG
jgi:hypothetical protein